MDIREPAAGWRLRVELVDGGIGMRLTTQGTVPGRWLVDAHHVLAEDCLEQFAQCRYWFSDHSALVGLELGGEHAREIAWISSRLARANPRLVVATLAPDDLVFGMARMWEAHTARIGWDVRTERGPVALIGWLEDRLGMPVHPLGPTFDSALFDEANAA